MRHDPRITPARGDLAAEHLAGLVEAERFVPPTPRTVCVPLAPVTATADGAAEMTTELLWGEAFDTYEEDGMWAWGQARRDGYVGYVPRTCLDVAVDTPPTHRIAALSAPVFAVPDFKTRPGGHIPYGARVAVAETVDGNQGRYARLVGGGFVPEAHLARLDMPASNWAGEAERFLGTPYLWGGRSPMGIDCSALVQLALDAAGQACPRDTDMQAGEVGETVAPGTPPQRGDLIFWKGHVGVMLDAERLLHANIHHMAVAVETLAGASARIAARDGGAVTRHARPGRTTMTAEIEHR